jgi:hypothetical protein
MPGIAQWTTPLGLWLLLCVTAASGRDAAEPKKPGWLAATLLQHAEPLQLSAAQRAKLQLLLERAQSSWRELSQRMADREAAATVSERSDWAQLAQERGRLRVLADRDALRVLDPTQRTRWLELQRGSRLGDPSPPGNVIVSRGGSQAKTRDRRTIRRPQRAAPSDPAR